MVEINQINLSLFLSALWEACFPGDSLSSSCLSLTFTSLSHVFPRSHRSRQTGRQTVALLRAAGFDLKVSCVYSVIGLEMLVLQHYGGTAALMDIFSFGDLDLGQRLNIM